MKVEIAVEGVVVVCEEHAASLDGGVSRPTVYQ